MTFQEAIHSTKPVLVDFFAEWCGPCKMMTPILKQLKEKISDRAMIIKIDIDKNPQAATALQVQGVPTLMIFKEGKMLWRESGVIPAAELEKIIARFT